MLVTQKVRALFAANTQPLTDTFSCNRWSHRWTLLHFQMSSIKDTILYKEELFWNVWIWNVSRAHLPFYSLTSAFWIDILFPESRCEVDVAARYGGKSRCQEVHQFRKWRGFPCCSLTKLPHCVASLPPALGCCLCLCLSLQWISTCVAAVKHHFCPSEGCRKNLWWCSLSHPKLRTELENL